jgi:hypothetical protein
MQCEECKAEFRTKGDYDRQRFCSDNCRGAFHRRRYRQERALTPPPRGPSANGKATAIRLAAEIAAGKPDFFFKKPDEKPRPPMVRRI